MRVWLSVATSVLVLVQALPPPWALTYTRSRGPCTLNPRGHAAAGPCTTLKEVHVYEVPGAFHWAVHPKPAGPRSCGAAHNPKINTFVRGPGGRRPAAGVEISPLSPAAAGLPPGPKRAGRGPRRPGPRPGSSGARGRSRNFPLVPGGCGPPSGPASGTSGPLRRASASGPPPWPCGPPLPGPRPGGE